MALDLSKSTIAVTGATGFIGGYIVRTLRSRGASVVGVVRNPTKSAWLAAADGVTLRKADLSDRAALAAGFEGCDAVISNAALISIGNEGRDALISANVEGVRNVMGALKDAGVLRAVHVSSAVVYAPKKGHFYGEEDTLLDETAKPSRFRDYATSKAIGEREAWRLAKDYGLALSTARPHTVYGSGDRVGFSRWFKRFMKPSWVSTFPKLAFPAVYAGDLADALCLMLESDAAAGNAYNVTVAPEEAQDFYAHVGAYRDAGGDAPKLVIPVPVPIRRRYDTSRAAQDLGFRTRPLVDGYRDMLILDRAEAS